MSAVLEEKSGLPDGWDRLAIEDIAEVNPRVNKSKISDDLKVSFVPMPAVEAESGSIDVSEERPFVEVKKGFTPFIEGDVLFAKITPCMENGKMAVVPKVKNGYGFGSTEFHVLRPKDGIESKWIYYFVSSRTFRGVAQHNMTGAVGQKRVPTNYLKQQLIPVAPPEQQKRIVAKIEELFSHIDAGIEALKKAKQLLKQYRQSVLKAAVTGELTKEWREANKDKLELAAKLLECINTERAQEFGQNLAEWEHGLAQWKSTGEKGKKPAKPKKPKELEPILDAELNTLGDLPDGWLWERLGNLAVDVFDGPFGSNLKSSDYVEKGIRVIRLENIGNLEFKNEKQSFVTPEKYELLKKHTVGSGDLIFSSFVADGTRVVVLPKTVETAINKADCFCVRCYGDSVYNKYLALFLATNSAYKRLKNEVHGATRPRINTAQLKNIEVPICSIEEQNEVVRILELKFDAITRLEDEIDEKLLMADKNKQSVLASAFSGGLQ